MIDVVKVKTGNRFEEHGSYSRVVAVNDLIFVSNTAGRKVEIEVTAYRGASWAEVKELKI